MSDLAERWIATNERLPEVNEYGSDYLIQDEYGNMFVANLSQSGWIPVGWGVFALDHKVVAWMPLPKPYRAERKEE